MLDGGARRQLAVGLVAAHAGPVSDDEAVGSATEDSSDDDVLDIGPRGNGSSWRNWVAVRLQQVPNGVRWTLTAVAVAALVGYGVARPAPHHSAGPVHRAPTSSTAATGTASHYPGLLQEYNEQRSANAEISASPRP
jgi:hypothetical protein